MSIRLMSEAWKSDMPSGKKLVLLALCDNANDQGDCYPSISMLVEKCSMSERSVFNHISDLEKDGAISRENRPGRSTIYHINPCKFCTPANSAPLQPLQSPLQILHHTPANSAPPPLQPLHPTPATVAPITIIEPSIEPNTKAQAPKCFVLPAWIPVDEWDGYVEMRKKKNKPMTDRARTLVIKSLESMNAKGHDVGAVLDASVKNSWIDVYEPKTLVQPIGIKRGSEEYAKLHKTAAWWSTAGFDNVWNAMSAGCYHDTSNRFSGGKKLQQESV